MSSLPESFEQVFEYDAHHTRPNAMKTPQTPRPAITGQQLSTNHTNAHQQPPNTVHPPPPTNRPPTAPPNEPQIAPPNRPKLGQITLHGLLCVGAAISDV